MKESGVLTVVASDFQILEHPLYRYRPRNRLRVWIRSIEGVLTIKTVGLLFWPGSFLIGSAGNAAIALLHTGGSGDN
jgi:hypothetical protein